MPKPTKQKSYRRGNSKHYAELARKSVGSRIKRHIEAEILVHPGSKAPARIRETDAGYDVFSPMKVTIRPKTSEVIMLGIHVKCPPGYFYEIRGRSSLNFRGIEVTDNVIDATYTGELRVRLNNNSSDLFHVEVGDKIAQLIFLPQIHVQFREVERLAVGDGERGKAGFGSTGN